MRRAAVMLFLLWLLVVGCAKPAVLPGGDPSANPAVAPAGQQPVAQPGAPAAQPAAKPTFATGQEAYAAALALIRQEKFSGAAFTLEQAVKLDPKLAEAWNDLSYVRLKSAMQYGGLVNLPNHSHTYQAEIDAAQQALALKPDWPFALYNLGLAQLASLRYEAAIAPLERSAELQPDRPEPLVALGLALVGAGRPAEALTACSRADQMQTPFPPSRNCLNLLRDGFRRLPESEAAVGAHAVLPAGKTSSVPPVEDKPEWIRVSPDWTCAQQYPDGYRVSVLNCGDPIIYGYQFNQSAVGTTPAGIRVGSPWADVIRAYGETVQFNGAYHYVVGNLELQIRGSEREGVTALGFWLPQPVFAVTDLVQSNGIPDPPGFRDFLLLGIDLGRSITEVETAFGRPERTVAGAEGEVRTYRGGTLQVTVRDDNVVGVAVTQRGWTERGISIGDTGSLVKRLYGQPSQEEANRITYLVDKVLGSPSKRLLAFDLQDGRVSGIRVSIR